MKFFLTIFAIAVVAQTAMAGTLPRSTRSDDDAEVHVEATPTELLSLAKEIIAHSTKVAADVLKELPEGEKYTAYRVDLDVYIDFGEVAAISDCGLVILKGLDNLYQYFLKYNSDSMEKTDEYFELEKLFKKHGGDELEKEAQDFKKSYVNNHNRQAVTAYIEIQGDCIKSLSKIEINAH